MSLNIKNEDAHRLASEIAKATGESLTEAVTTALAERLERLKTDEQRERQRIIDEVMRITDEVQKHLVGPPIDIDEFLYDEHGLPK